MEREGESTRGTQRSEDEGFRGHNGHGTEVDGRKEGQNERDKTIKGRGRREAGHERQSTRSPPTLESRMLGMNTEMLMDVMTNRSTGPDFARI